ncbi:MAG TPA: hypothetical protein VFK85_08320 [Anaeromyxobacteraceae bacterium]|nr:hypothetical protein [Anaeromyxobacteraceae bacterium]
MDTNRSGIRKLVDEQMKGVCGGSPVITFLRVVELLKTVDDMTGGALSQPLPTPDQLKKMLQKGKTPA